ncbi:MAG: hypothetical protein M3R06_01940 [Chloroflexota bacterium]|nr:hypothetical protein [Chloroflexota bacterium]
MLRKLMLMLTAALVITGLALTVAAPAEASHRRDGGDQNRDRGYSNNNNGGRNNQQDPYLAVSYINPDTGSATENADVDPDSDCDNPDRTDTQMVSPAGTTTNNVHNDACLFSGGYSYGQQRFDGPVSWDSSGVGVISACPDPDGPGGPKTATNTGTRCTQTGFQTTGMAGDTEYHIRLNSFVAGTQTVVFCYDPELNGCGDAQVKDQIVITWVA